MKKISLIISIMFVQLTACSNHPDTLLQEANYPTQEVFSGDIVLDKAWKKFEELELQTDEEIMSNDGYDVLITVNSNTITRTDNERIYNSELKTKRGKIIGTNGGEWGGEIKYIPNFGLGYDLVNKNFLGFYMIDNRAFVLTGLGHMTVDEGSIYELLYTNGRWKAEYVLDLNSEPQTYLIINNTLYVVTNKSLLLIEDNKITKSIYGKNMWNSLYPNSMIVVNSTVYFGIRGGMISVNTNNNTIERYVLDASINEKK